MTASKPAPNPLYWLFAVIAVGAHLALLLIPLRQAQQVAGTEALQIEFAVQQAPDSPAEKVKPEPSQAETPEPVLVAPAEIGDSPNREMATTQPASRPEMKSVTATMLLQQVPKLERNARVDPLRRLGIASVEPLPAHWTEPLIPAWSGPFAENFAPLENEILDQWQEADGTRRVVMRTLTGHTLCGRMQRWDPTNPLFEPVPMFYTCGGGGRRD